MDKPYSILYNPSAVRDMKDIAEYIRADSPQAAEQTKKLFEDSIGNLAEFPQCPISKDKRLARKGDRMVVGGNYLIFYQIFEREVHIRRILHGKRSYGFLL